VWFVLIKTGFLFPAKRNGENKLKSSLLEAIVDKPVDLADRVEMR